MVEILEPNTCIRGCCTSQSIPLHLCSSSYSLNSPIARGTESVVYEASLEGQKVAVKKPILSTSDDLDRFHQELQLLCKLDHPGIATLVAAHARPPNYMFFFQFYECHNLAKMLHVEEWNPTIDQALSIAIELAKALQYIHNLGVAHRDVKPSNVLLDRKLQPHLADFGLAVYKKDLKQVSMENWRSSGKPTGGFHKKNMVGTLIYMAPEILRKEVHTEKSDVYSFAITINEIVTGVIPYTDLRAEAQAHTVLEMNYTEQRLTAAVVTEGLRPSLASPESGAPSTMLSLIQVCWDSDPQKRPSFDDIVRKLESIIKNHRQDVKCQRNPSDKDQLPINMDSHQQFEGDINWLIQGVKASKEILPKVEPRVIIWLYSSPNSLLYHPTLSWGSFSTRGRRETMEDTHFLLPQMEYEKNISLFGIFDGHRGAAAAEFAVQAIPGFFKSLTGATTSPADALVGAFVNTDLAFRKELESCRKSHRKIQKDWHPGCTGITSLIIGDTLFVANAGDCRAILCRQGLSYSLSKDHVANCPKERERVIEAGGQVKWQIDAWRVGVAALQVTRSIGDDDLKPAVTAEPEITQVRLSEDDEYLVMASDGLWDVVCNEDVVSIIRDTVKEPGMCSKRLATEAAERGSKDNITVIVVFLRPVSTAERIY
ncbi:hypothetical protein AMTR_s00051p00099980 [Amborella trichopoda]|uniref:Protein kinase and PP2C-like domain-containing protein n=2 Tax=Amborella trichopoda TaxID=13333 RepID=U5D5E6_AMBTC|nr:hypothetical protein AMTR_s00051p00099980 [Amborella trichopoda]